jgi:hypothetical protein
MKISFSPNYLDILHLRNTFSNLISDIRNNLIYALPASNLIRCRGVTDHLVTHITFDLFICRAR